MSKLKCLFKDNNLNKNRKCMQIEEEYIRLSFIILAMLFCPWLLLLLAMFFCCCCFLFYFS